MRIIWTTRVDFSDSLDIQIDTARSVGDAFIPALPPRLQVVPGFRVLPGMSIPHGWQPTPGEQNPYEDITWRSDYFSWQEQFLEFREWTWQQGSKDTRFANNERIRCFGDGKKKQGCPKYFGAMYAHIQEPRAAGMRTSSVWLPFIPYHYQLHQTDNFLRIIGLDWEIEEDCWEPKSRGMGVSWNRSKDDLWVWLTIPYARALLMSRTQDFVDKPGNIDALFQKILEMHHLLPDYIKAPGFQDKPPFRVKNLIRNPHSKAEIIGTANTREAGRAGRYLYGFVDEAAKIEDLNGLLGSLRGSMKKTFYTSTEDREVVSGQEWLEEWQGTKRHQPMWVVEWNWHQNPTMDVEWERRVLKRATTDKQRHKVHLEYFRDVFAGFGKYIYPEASKLPDRDWPYDPAKPLTVCTDPGKEDDVAFTVGQTTVAEDGQRGFHVLFSYQRNLVEVEWMAHLRTGVWPGPEDRCWGIHPTPEEELIGAFFYQRWMNGDLVDDYMDPYGDAALAGYSYKNMLYDKSMQLRAREKQRLIGLEVARQARESTRDEDAENLIRKISVEGINARTGLLKKYKTHHQRRLATRVFLPYFTFQAGVPSAAWVRTCLSNSRFKEMGNDAVTEPKPVHDQYFHITSCIEFTMIYYYYGWTDPEPTFTAQANDGRKQKRNRRPTNGRQSKRQKRSFEAPQQESIGNRYPVHPAEVVPY